MGQREAIVLLHGLGRTSTSMEPLARVLRRDGFAVLNLDLPTRRLGIDALADHVEHASAAWRSQHQSRSIHLVGHSLGGLVARAWVAAHRPSRLGRILQLGPPNGGSEIADLLASFRAFSRVFGPAAAQLTTMNATRETLLGPIDYPLGIIAGTRTLDPLGWLVLPRPNDGKVSVARTHATGAAAHLVLPVTHTLMMRNPRVIAAARRFLAAGRF